MGLRRDIREAAAQFLYARDLHPAGDHPADLESFWSLHAAPDDVRRGAGALVNNVLAHLPEIDRRLAAATRNFRLERLSVIDRNILRVAVFEIIFDPEVPAAVAINEAIEIARRFGTEESARFTNGVLDRVRRDALPAQDDDTTEPADPPGEDPPETPAPTDDAAPARGDASDPAP